MFVILDGAGDEELSVFYTYDSRNRLIGVDSETTQAAYTYDALGRRSSKTVNGDTTKHIWSGSEIVEDTDADGGVKAKYYRGINPVATVTKTAGEATVYYYRYDEKGSVTSMSGSGGIALSYEYDAFGNQTEAEGDVYNPYRYTGEYYDEETGFVYLRNRYYDPSIGRFTQEDPAKDGANWYVYCGNNPITFIDPSGMYITCSENESKEIINMLSELTDDELEYQNGRIVITKTYDADKHVGQTLIKDLIDDPNSEININLGFDPNMSTSEPAYKRTNKATWYDTSKITIWVDNGNTLGLGAQMMDTETGEIAWTEFDDFMVLGHEMIHAWRAINDHYLPEESEVGGVPDGEYRYGSARQEELQTTGLFYKAPGYKDPKSFRGTITENGLRLENGMKLRLQY